MFKSYSAVLALAALAAPLYAVETKSWVQNEQADYEKGTLKRLSLRSDGRLLLAPVLREIYDSSNTYLWTVAEDSKGNLYTGGAGSSGAKAKLFQIDPAGKAKTLTELEGLEIHAIALNKQDEVFAATSPDSKVYRIDRAGKATLFYDPKAKYVWAMVFDSKGNLFLATGDAGEIHKVTPNGQGSVFFRTDETHARSMIIDDKDQLIVGTEPSGLVLRISPSGEGFVLYQTGKREVTAVALAPNGAIYAAGVGNKQPGGASVAAPAVPTAPPPPAGSAGSTPSPARGTPAPNAPSSLVVGGPSIPGGSEVYRIEPDGYARKVWSQSQDLIYALAFDPQGKPLVGTGNRGNIYRLDSDTVSTQLVSAVPTQVTGFTKGRNGRLYLVTGNIGKVFQLGPELEKQGTYESEVFDANSFTYWGRLSFKGNPAQGKLQFETHSGNLERPQKNWSPWAPVVITGDGGRSTSPAARFVQYRVTLTGNGAEPSPLVDAVELAYRSKNIAPVIEAAESTPANYKFPAPSTAAPATSTPSLTLPPLGQRKRSSTASSSIDAGVSMTYAKGWTGVRWAASDENGDTLTYRVEIRGLQERDYKLLRDGLRERYYSWDSISFPDGEYRIRITAYDAGDNPAGEGLTGTGESDVLVVDNTPPQISTLTGSIQGNQVKATWRAKDAGTVISKAEYSLNGSDWKRVEPTTRITDSPEHEYNLTVDRVGTGEQTLAVRVTDDFDNQSVQKVVLR